MNQLQTKYPSFNRHPVTWIERILSYYIDNQMVSESVSLTLSKYHYLPQSFKDERKVFSLPFWQLTNNTLIDIIASLNSDEELAFHSQIFNFGSAFHIPLIDFGNVDRGIIDSSTLKELALHWNLSFNIYNSGRSYHAYGNRLLSNDEWLKFMGSLLLLNKSSGFKLIDERWVGHRLMAGYSSLRWSCNTKSYKKTPIYVGYLNPDGLFLEENPSRYLE